MVKGEERRPVLGVEMLGAGSLDAAGESWLSGLPPAPSASSWVPRIRAQVRGDPGRPSHMGKAAVHVSSLQCSDFMSKIHFKPPRNWSEVYLCTSQSTPLQTGPAQSNKPAQLPRDQT